MALINDFLDFARMEEAAHAMKRVARRSRRRGGGDRRRFQAAGRERRPADRGSTSQGPRPVVLGRSTALAAGAHQPGRERGQVHAADGQHRACGRALGRVAGARSASWTTAPASRRRCCRRCSSATRARRASGTTRAAPASGLLIVREIVEAHGGTVGVDSTPGQGSRFWFRIPVDRSAQRIARRRPPARAERRSNQTQRADGFQQAVQRERLAETRR